MSKGKRARHLAKLKRRELKVTELGAIVERAKSGPLSDDDYETLKAAVDTLAFLTQELEAKGASVERLRRLLFGPSTEKTSQVLGESPAPPAKDAQAAAAARAHEPAGSVRADETAKPKGHGRNGAAAYRGAKKVRVTHASLRPEAHCPECQKGKVYPLAQPAVLLRIQGMAPLGATVYELDRVRCNLCGEVFTAEPPPGIGTEKYDETAASMIGLLKYGCGVPFNRIERLERDLGIPLPSATQWEVVRRAATLLEITYAQLALQAAQGDVLYNDDTTMKILELTKESRQEAVASDSSDERTGVFTSGIVSTGAGHRIALFFTGRQHAGENLADLLARRAAELSAPIQMCDALSRNVPGELRTILANCIAHARRRFIEVVDNFPDECRFVLETLRDVYRNDALAREQKMSPKDRLRFHQSQSGPLMGALEQWLRQQIDEHRVEPNSGLGEAIAYMQKHWSKLTLFLRVAGAPLDNNLCERSLKKAILHRKNALFYKTLNGAHVGDIFMSLIHTAELCHVEVFEYLVALQRHHEHVTDNPADWMPWNYTQALSRINANPALTL